MATQSNYSFEAFNAAVKPAGAGLKLFLAMSLMRDVVSTLEHFDNPLEDDARGVLNEMKAFRVQYKAAAAAKAEKTGKLMASDGQSE